MTNDGKMPIVKVITRYSYSNIYRWSLGVLNALIKPKLLSPEMFGLWNLLTLVKDYANYSDLGSSASMRYLIPYHEARKENKKALEIRGTVYYGTLYGRVIVSACLVMFALIADLNRESKVGIITIAFINCLQWYEEYYVSSLKSYQQFILVSHGNYIRTSIAVFLGAVLMYFHGIYGLYAAAICSSLGVIFYFRARYPMDAPEGFRHTLYMSLIRTGIPIVLFNLFMILIRTTDRIIVASFLGVEQLGYYGIAGMVLGFLLQIPGVSREVLEPRLMEVVGTEPQEKTMNDYFFKPLINTAYFMPFLVGAFFFMLPVMVTLFLPRYTSGIVPTQIELLGGYFLALSFMTRGIIVAKNWQLRSLRLLAAALLTNVLLSSLLLSAGYRLNGVALSSSISFFVLFVGLLVLVKVQSGCESSLWKSNILPLCWPFPLMCITLLALELMFRSLPVSIYITTIMKLVLFFAVMLVFFRIAQKHYPLLKGIKVSDVA